MCSSSVRQASPVFAAGVAVVAGLVAFLLFLLPAGQPRTLASILVLAGAIGVLLWLVRWRRRRRPAIERLIDPITGLPNRIHAELFLEREFALAELGRPLAVVIFDIDDFDAFVRKNGDAASNGVLRTIATILRQNTRRMNIAARFGPDQFICLLSGAPDDGAFIFAQRIQEHLRAAGAVATLPTASAGIGCYSPDMESPRLLLRAAGDALRSAQGDGGDRVRVAGWSLEQLDRPPLHLVDSGAAAPHAGSTPATMADPERSGPVVRTAFVFSANGALRKRVIGALEDASVRSTHGSTPVHGIRPLNTEFDIVVLDLLAGGVPDMIREIRLRYPATRIVGVTDVTAAGLDAAVLTARVDGRYLEQRGEWMFVPALDELMRERDRDRDAALRSRQLSDEVRAREREARRVVEEAEAKLRSVEHAIQEVVFSVDAGGTWLSLNPAWTSITGRAVPDTIGQPFAGSFHGADRPMLESDFESLLAMEKPYVRREARVLLSGGGLCWIELRAQVALDRAGQPLGITGTLVDVTARRAAEDALKRNEEYFRALIENAADVVAVFDERGVLRYASPALDRVLGYDAEQIAGETAVSLVHPADVAILRLRLRRLSRREGASIALETRVRHADRTWRTLAITIRNLQHVAAVRGFVVNARDVTAVREAELAVRERDEELLRTRKMDAIGVLAGGVAHDFNNLLTAIQGNADLVLAELSADHPGRRDLVEIQASAGRAASLTRQLLAFGRRLVLQPEVFDLNVLVSDMQKMLVRLIGDAIHLHSELAASPPRVQADPSQIEQVILNLAVNAREEMPDGGQLTLRTDNVTLDTHDARARELIPGHYVRLSVSDTGRGIAESALPRIFDPFFSTKAEEGRPAGLGLSTVYGIVKQSGGHVTASSRTRPADDTKAGGATGTTFTILLPQATQAPSLPDQHAAEPAGERGAETIALVEDEKAVRDLAARILRKKGYHVLPAENGRDAVDVIARYPHRIDMLVTDVIMPEMNGRDLADRIHIMRPGVKILFMSGYSAEAIARHGVLARGAAFLEKPFSPSALLRKVRELLDAAGEPTVN